MSKNHGETAKYLNLCLTKKPRDSEVGAEAKGKLHMQNQL